MIEEELLNFVKEDRAQSSTNDEKWSAFESKYGTTFPQDYKAIVALFSPIELFSFVYLLNPFDKEGQFQVTDDTFDDILNREISYLLDTLEHDEIADIEFESIGDNLFPIGGTENGDLIIYIRSGKPEEWNVLFTNEDYSNIEIFKGNLSQFLYSFISGNYVPKPFSQEVLMRQGWPIKCS
jgi:hypothetical protein